LALPIKSIIMPHSSARHAPCRSGARWKEASAGTRRRGCTSQADRGGWDRRGSAHTILRGPSGPQCHRRLRPAALSDVLHFNNMFGSPLPPATITARSTGWCLPLALYSGQRDIQSAPNSESRKRRCDVDIRNYLRDLVFDLSITHDRYGSSSHPLQNGRLTHPQNFDAPLHIAAQRKIKSSR